MRILAFADIDPKIDIHAHVAQFRPDLITTLGDLVPAHISALADIDTVPKIGVYGNHCSGTYFDRLGIQDMHLSTWEFAGLRFGGFQGCVRYKPDPKAIMCTQAEATALLADFPPVDVFLSHCPPHGINDEPSQAHQGFTALREYLDSHRPEMWLHGHTYPTPATEIRQHGKTRIEYVHGHKLISR